jgi:hypothetical protein
VDRGIDRNRTHRYWGRNVFFPNSVISQGYNDDFKEEYTDYFIDANRYTDGRISMAFMLGTQLEEATEEPVKGASNS